jgi:hypothetical protein
MHKIGEGHVYVITIMIIGNLCMIISFSYDVT